MMKKLYPYCLILLLTVLSVLGCRRQEFEYGIVAEFPGLFGVETQKCIMVITDLDNNVLVEKEIPNFTSSTLIETFNLRLKKPVEVFNAHLILEWPTGDDLSNTHIYSHIGLKNSGSFSIMPDTRSSTPPTPNRMMKINLGKSNYQYSYHFVGAAINSLAFSPEVLYEATLQEGQGLVIIRDDLSTSQKKRFYLPPEMIRDSIHIASSQFIHFPQSIEYTLDKLPWGNQVQAFATSPDKKKFVLLENNFFDVPGIAVPEEIPSDWNFYFQARAPNSFVEKEAPRNVKSVNLNPQISLKSKNYKNGFLHLACGDGVDWVRTQTYSESNSAGFSPFVWDIEGHPDMFKRWEVPDLTPYIRDAAKVKATLFQNYNVTLISSGEFDYEDILKGLPWKTGEPFRNGKNGLEILTIY
jgi:hypothetical protein